MSTPPTPTGLVVMGVSGVGKTTAAAVLAERLGCPHAEADAFHSPANVDKMAAGVPLTDDDRTPWLEAIRDWIGDRADAGDSVVVTCSALKRSYRDILRQARARVRFVHLDLPAGQVAARLASRSGHFMPPSLLRSQFDDLEPLAPDEDGVTLDATASPTGIVESAVTRLGLGAW